MPSVIFRTNVDCCKRFVYAINDKKWTVNDVNPCVGDHVVVLQSNTLELPMRVIYRRWENLKPELGNSPVLVVELHLLESMHIALVESIVRAAGYPTSP